jgi:hypothetical protein
MLFWLEIAFCRKARKHKSFQMINCFSYRAKKGGGVKTHAAGRVALCHCSAYEILGSLMKAESAKTELRNLGNMGPLNIMALGR